MNTLATVFNAEVGYSDHTEGVEVSVAAVALGAKVIEKHYTIDKSLPGPDHKASLDPIELKTLVDQIRNVERAISGFGTKQLHSSEIETKKVVQKGIYLTKDIALGEIITDDCLIMKRPVTYLNASDYDLVIGKKASKAIKKGAALNLIDLSFE
jgi:N-acetylneuraminate synthase/N,N'-diacetyllegionaminate synthase